MRVVMFVIVGIFVLYVVGYMLYSSYKSRKLQRQLKYGREVAANLPDDDGTVGPVKTIKRGSKEFEETFRIESDSSQDLNVSHASVSEKNDSVSQVKTEEKKNPSWAKYYQFNIVSRDHRPFTFSQLRDVFLNEKLSIGKYDIVYYNDPATGKELFRVSSMIKPGTFPRAIAGNDNSYSSSSWSTKGISVIMFLPEKGSAETRFDQIIAHVRRLNTALDGLLCTRELRPLTDDVIEEYRSQMRSYDSQP